MFPTDETIINTCKQYTMTSYERQLQTLNSIAYVVENNIDGDIIEIGVWKGGGVMMMLYKLLQLGVRDRNVHLYDTFNGMTEASDLDINPHGQTAKDENYFNTVRCDCPYDITYNNIKSVGYPMELIHFHVGDIRYVDKISIPKAIAVLRLDNDWYELYKFELPLFEPNVSTNGIITIDDYGYWSGCKLAVDEYIKDKNVQLNVIDDCAVFWKKSIS